MPRIGRCVVVGAGVLGLAVARSLARRGWSVDVLEAAPEIGHPRAGSKGGARIFRLGYPERRYVEMALAAREEWRTLERDSGRALLHVTGQLSLGDDDTLASIGAALRARGAAWERLDPGEARARWPGVATAGAALFEPDSGVLAADACLDALRATADFEVREATPVAAVHPGDDGVRIVTASGEVLQTDVVVVCAGPSTIGLLGAGSAAVSTAAAPPSLPQVAYFRVAEDVHVVPVFIEWGEDMVYGLPVPSPAGASAPGLLKVSHHTPGAPLERFDPLDTTALPDDPVLLAGLVAAVRRLLPEADPEPVASERCVYDNSADADFILDRVGNVVIGCGTSGHGFKFAPLLGELLADLAEGVGPSVDLGAFALLRH